MAAFVLVMRPRLQTLITVGCLATLVFLRAAYAQPNPPAFVVESEAMSALEKRHGEALRAYRAGEPAQAVRLLEPVLSDAAVRAVDPDGQHPGVTAILNDYGFFLAEAGLHERAVPVLQVVVARAPDRTVAYLNLADAEQAQGQAEIALDHYRRYADLMLAAGKADKIPARVAERTGAAYGVTFVVKEASNAFDVTIRVAKCVGSSCEGAVVYSFHAKGNPRAFQIIEASHSVISLGDGGRPLVNEVRHPYSAQSAIYVADFNFDGIEDVALCTGTEGSYHTPSYDVYLGSKQAKNANNAKSANNAKTFLRSAALSKLGTHLGMFEVDPEQRRLTITDKDGCCWHVTRSYAVVSNRPVMVYELIEDGTSGKDEVTVTERTLVRGKWKTVKR